LGGSSDIRRIDFRFSCVVLISKLWDDHGHVNADFLVPALMK